MVDRVSVMLALPFRVDESGAIATTTDPNEQLTHRVFSVLATALGDRVMRPNYGWDFNSFLFEPIDGIDEKHMLRLAQNALSSWEPQANLIGAHFEKTDEAQMSVSLFYTPAGSDTVITSVLSFGSSDSTGAFTEVLVSDLSNTAAAGS